MRRSNPQGIGLGLRTGFASELLCTQCSVDWLEIVPEQWLGMGGERARVLAACAERWTVVPHGTSLSIGGPVAPDVDYVEAMRGLIRQIRAPFWSDHISYSNLAGNRTGELLPLPFTEEAVLHVARRIRDLQSTIDVPLVFENATYYATMPGTSMTELEFLQNILATADCGLLLDVNNVYVNAVNHAFDPYTFIDGIPMQCVRQIHVAGHTRESDFLIDTHRGPVPQAVWDLYRYALRRANRLIPTLIEWDTDIPALGIVLAEVEHAREVAASALGVGESIA